MPLRAENGKILEIKEPIVLDAEGRTVFTPSDEGQPSGHVRVFKWGSWAGLLSLILLGAAMVLGTFVFGFAVVVFLVFWLVRTVMKNFGLRP